MTEYDFSPEAYERHIENLHRVSNWVTDQASRTNQYSNPFVPPAADYDQHHSSSRHAGTSARHTYSPAPHDYRSEPQRAPDGYYRSSHSGHTSPRYDYGNSVPLAYPPQGYPPGATTYRTYDASAREVVIPAPRPGETYVIIPPKGRRVQVVTDGSSTVRSSSPSSRRSLSKKSPPLIKRLFSNLGPPSSRDSGYHSRSSSRDRSRSY